MSSKGPFANSGLKAIEKLGLGSLAPGPDGHPRYYIKFVNSLGIKAQPVMQTDSFEVLRSAAVAGALVAILPKSIARKAGPKLQEITDRPTGQKLETGRHKIYLAYMDRCDVREGEYLARIARKIFLGMNAE